MPTKIQWKQKCSAYVLYIQCFMCCLFFMMLVYVLVNTAQPLLIPVLQRCFISSLTPTVIHPWKRMSYPQESGSVIVVGWPRLNQRWVAVYTPSHYFLTNLGRLYPTFDWGIFIFPCLTNRSWRERRYIVYWNQLVCLYTILLIALRPLVP